MRKHLIHTLLAALVLSTGATAANAAGCISGAVVGGVAGHLVHHGFLGAAGGCIVGHEMAKKQKEQAKQAALARQNGQASTQGATPVRQSPF